MANVPTSWGFSPGDWMLATEDGHNFTLLEDVYYRAKSGELITIQAGSMSDGASTPQAIWNVLPPFGKYFKAAYLHDHEYRYGNRPKCQCDALLKEAMESLNCDEPEILTIYSGVVIGGDCAFQEDRATK